MNQSPEQLALQHHMALCQGHAEALQDAVQLMSLLTRFQSMHRALAQK